ncbi:MAG: DUF370 domain-containing protein [Oscillospiraceae bacterium]|nr:DUF370 domain-containing protein [Oscillospiraceae bacterium]MBQ2792554.1 DUF370 domain-containing protein [Oscillospiraceae bacterium]MBQ3242586.1 DUF370 domain-containing protein [Oscillospiraceae bacterium]MBQ7082265.1 DUF370 domain-containing protein [Oscillospiraceae bacterium]MBR2635449.1 DUF370 domain-containing protein [Oscillospiraceae bacterium]
MYLHLGQNTVVRTASVVGIFDIENTSTSRLTRSYLSQAEKSGQVVNVSTELPKSFVVCREGKRTVVYISQISPATLKKRMGYLSELSNL